MRVLSYFRDGNGASHPNYVGESWRTRESARKDSILGHGDFFTADATMYPSTQALHNQPLAALPNWWSHRNQTDTAALIEAGQDRHGLFTG
jgi:hypothetical protein